MLVGAYGVATIQSLGAINTGTIRVPLSWCPIEGSPAVDNPNIPDPWGGVDTTTNDVLWRRHERVTDNIYHPEGTRITFRSAILDELNTMLDFPHVPDPNPNLGSPGDVDKEDPYRTEYYAMKNACLSAWENMTPSGTVHGIPTINVNRFVHSNGNLYNDIIGASLCVKDAPGSTCEEPWSGYVFVIDNCYTAVGATCGWNNDPYDQNLAHELGHVLGLNHRNTASALMNEEQQENGPGGVVNNIHLTNQEIMALRMNALLVPDVEIDPVNKIIKGQIVQGIRVDDIQENNTTLPFVDISSYRVTVNKNQSDVYLDEDLFGLIPEEIKQGNKNPIQYWTLLNLDNDTKTGGNSTILKNLGVPPTKLVGVDMVLLSQINNTTLGNNTDVLGNAWFVTKNGSKVASLSSDQFNTELKTMYLETHYRNITESNTDDIPVSNTISTTLNDFKQIKVNQPFSIQSIVYFNGSVADTLDDEMLPGLKTITLKDPLFPQCFPENDAQSGQNATIHISGLLPNSNIHLLIGPRMIANGSTNNFGNSTIGFTIPEDVTSGLHLITVGVNDTALTADCEINIKPTGQKNIS